MDDSSTPRASGERADTPSSPLSGKLDGGLTEHGARAEANVSVGGEHLKAGLDAKIEGAVTRADGQVHYTLEGSAAGFVEANAAVRGFGGGVRVEQGGTARFEVAVPESAANATELRAINPFEPATMPVGTRITMDAAHTGSVEMTTQLRQLSTRDRVSQEQGVEVAIEALDQQRVRVTAGPREAVDAYHGIGLKAGPASAMLGREDQLKGGTLHTAEFDLSNPHGRQAYDDFMRTGTMPERDAPGLSQVSTVTTLDMRSEGQVELGLGSHSTTLSTGANSGQAVRTVHGDGSAEISRTLRYREHDVSLKVDQAIAADGTPGERTYRYTLTPDASDAQTLNALYGRDGSAPFKAGEPATLRFSEQEMTQLQAQTARANQNIARTGSNDVIRLLSEPAGRTPEAFATDLIRNPTTLASLPITLHTVALRSGEEARDRPLTLSPLPGQVETGRDPQTNAALRAATDRAGYVPSPLALDEQGHPDHALYAAIRDRAPSQVGDDHLHQATLLARHEGITAARLQHVVVQDQTLWLAGNQPGQRTSVDLAQPAPPARETSAQLLAMPAQQETAQQERQASQAR
ncbi:hypothetical protein SAMN05428989_2167 [Pseudoxanthomonas sp. GM95]|uniref:hypothetical protein n=1 Tax=Pseudoxanthomonas sp. GM95 TaxID=1881043 RepID=UPI0008B4A530|nr:hypothetical protein [Pseudoxanthomonas sp. GM95]SEL65559.1 hypothetical protein SAMN05428989_2167 [Pseudoxanthomonas sp. GM95]